MAISVGIGYDSHRFAEGRKLILGGSRGPLRTRTVRSFGCRCAHPRVQVGSLAGEMKYYWNVRGFNIFGYGPWSGTGAANFTITTSTVPAKPILISPTGVSSLTTPTYSWDEVNGAINYMLYVSNSSGVVIRDETFSAAEKCSGGICSVTTTTPLASEEVYYWTARGYNLAGYGQWGATKTFTVTLATIPGEPTLVSPVGVIGTTSPTYTWNVLTGVPITRYRLLVYDAAGVKINNIGYTPAEAGCAAGEATCSITPATVLAEGDGVWYVRAQNGTEVGPWSAGLSFRLQTIPVPPAPVEISPNGSITANTPTYTWSALTGVPVTRYRLLVYDATGVKINNIGYTPAEAGCAVGEATCSITPATVLAEGDGVWYVRAQNGTEVGPWSAGMTFTVQ